MAPTNTLHPKEIPHAGSTRVPDGRHLHGTHHDQAHDPVAGADHRAHRLRPLRRGRPRHRRHGDGRGEVDVRNRGPAHVRHHVLRHHDRRGPLRQARRRHPEAGRQRPGQGRHRHRAAHRPDLPGRRRVDHVHRGHRGLAADLPAPGHEPGGADLRGRPDQRHAEHRPVGRPDRPRRRGAARRRLRGVRPDASGAGRRPGRGLRLRLGHGHLRTQAPAARGSAALGHGLHPEHLRRHSQVPGSRAARTAPRPSAAAAPR